ncbi:glycosyltransferase family 1 protein [Erythrobacteraceae bacterium CFH 75059]|uniref:glycosyltransferase n=1 Tax=Qipengyuania thermophila TaxID=2509361 RepID=UPI0010214CD9|nr:glycosyltransferase [Qipengyuania thermophila]TCD06505.1 glycosyltransferase family 1 protein [Erythrobacteraceae bacterium CFH 75059]
MLLNNPPLGVGEAPLASSALKPRDVVLFGGLPQSAAILAELERRGHRTARLAAADGEEGARKPTLQGRLVGVLALVSALLALGRLLRHRRPDALIVSGAGPVQVLVPVLLARLTGTPVWLHLPAPQHWPWRRRESRGAAPRAMALAARGEARLGRRILSAAAVVSAGSATAAAALRSFAACPREVTVLRPPASEPAMTSAPVGSALSGRRVVLCHGACHGAAAATLLVRVAARLRRSHDDVVLVVAGEDEGRGQPAEDGVVAVAPAVHAALTRHAAVHLLLRTGDEGEGGRSAPLGTLLGSGRPVVAAGETGWELVREIIGAGTIPVRADAETLAAALDELLSDAELAGALGAEGARRAAIRFSAQGAADRIEAVLAGSARHG